MCFITGEYAFISLLSRRNCITAQWSFPYVFLKLLGWVKNLFFCDYKVHCIQIKGTIIIVLIGRAIMLWFSMQMSIIEIELHFFANGFWNFGGETWKINILKAKAKMQSVYVNESINFSRQMRKSMIFKI